MSAPEQAGYRPEIDGLRAIAVCAVIFFHAGFAWCPGGFVGVDVFFVISGFLITSIILDEQQRGLFTLRNFYARRARRILPALALMLVVCIAPAAVLMTRAQLEDFFQMQTAVALFSSNWVLAQSTGYFDGPAELRPLLHTWSLAVEEQYYFAFPLLLLGCRQWGLARLLALLTVLALASLAMAEWGWRHQQNYNFFSTFSRVWELLVGSIAAVLALQWQSRQKSLGLAAPHPSNRVGQALSALGLAAIVFSLLAFDRLTPSPSLWCLLPTGGTALVLLFGRQGTWVARLLSQRLLVGVGLVSYSAYLWHQPLLAFAKINQLEPLSLPLTCGLIAATFVLAFLTWKFVEQPMRKLKSIPPARALSWALACTLALAVLGLSGNLAAQKLSVGLPANVAKAFEPPPRQKECFDIPYAHNKPDGWLCQLNPGAQKAPSFVLFGDSHAVQVLGAFEAAAKQTGRSGIFAGFSGCAPLLGVYPLTRPDQATQNCPVLNQRMLSTIKQNRIKDVFLVAKWSYYTDYWNGTQYLSAIGLSPSDPVTIESSRRAFEQGLDNTVRAYKALGVRLHVVEQVPQQLYPPQTIYQRALADPYNPGKLLREASVKREAHRQLQSFAASAFGKPAYQGTLSVVNFDDVLCDPQICPMGTPGSSYYFDPSHLSEDGARRLVPAIAGLLGKPAR